MTSLLASILIDSLSEISTFVKEVHDGPNESSTHVGDEETEGELFAPSILSALRLIESNPQVILQSGDDGVPNIFYALHSYPVVRVILSHCPDQARVVRNSRQNDLPLHAACGTHNVAVETVRLLMTHYPEAVALKTGDGKLPLHVAATNPSVPFQILTLLCSAHPEGVHQTENRNASMPLHYACAFRVNADAVRVLLRYNVKAVQIADNAGNLPLHLALLYKAPQEVVEALLDEYPDAVRLPDAKGRLALHLATISAHSVDVVEKIVNLFSSACDVYCPDCGRPPKKPIHFAIRQMSNIGVIKLLLGACLEQKADTSVCGDTLLHSAVEFSAPLEVIRAILDVHPKAAEEINEDGKLPIHFAAWHQSPVNIINLLLEKFSDAVKKAEVKGGNLPLHYAIQYSPQGPLADVSPALQLLEAYPAAVFETNSKGFYPIHLAARSRCPIGLLDALLKFCPFSVGFADKDPNACLLPVDYALRMNASADVISRLLGVSTLQESNARTEIIQNRHQRKQTNYIEETTSDSPVVQVKEKGLKDALIDLQSKYAAQGEELRGLRRKMDKQTKELQAKIGEIRSLKHDMSWRDDKIRILDRELEELKKELASLR